MSSGTSYFAKNWRKAVNLCMYCEDIQEDKVFENVCACNPTGNFLVIHTRD